MMRRLGSAWMVVAALCFALMGFFAAQGSGDLPPFEILFYRTFVGLLILMPMMRWRGESLYSRHWLAHSRRSLVGYLSMAMLFYALGQLPLASAVTLNYTSSLSFALCCVVLRQERLPRKVWFALSLGFVGIACMLRPTFDAGQWFAGLMGLGSGIGAGLALYHVRELGELGERPVLTVFWLYCLSTIFGLALVMVGGGFHGLDGELAMQMLAVGLFGLGGQLAMTRAYKEGRKFVVSNLAYLTVAFSALIGVFVSQQQLPLLSWLGMTLIIGSGMLAARR